MNLYEIAPENMLAWKNPVMPYLISTICLLMLFDQFALHMHFNLNIGIFLTKMYYIDSKNLKVH